MSRFALIVYTVALLAGCGQPTVIEAPSTPNQPQAATSAPSSTTTQAQATASAPSSTTTQVATLWVQVKYRDTPVDLLAPHFEFLPTEGSSVVNGAWYDRLSQYMVIALDSTFYHYCSLPDAVWSSFSEAGSFGSFYNSQIKGRYDCRQGFVPDYP